MFLHRCDSKCLQEVTLQNDAKTSKLFTGSYSILRSSLHISSDFLRFSVPFLEFLEKPTWNSPCLGCQGCLTPLLCCSAAPRRTACNAVCAAQRTRHAAWRSQRWRMRCGQADWLELSWDLTSDKMWFYTFRNGQIMIKSCFNHVKSKCSRYSLGLNRVEHHHLACRNLPKSTKMTTQFSASPTSSNMNLNYQQMVPVISLNGQHH